jgi:tetratricopeptide (TPR) repeat protein
MCRPIIPFNAFISAAIISLLLTGCNQAPQKASTKNWTQTVLGKSITKSPATKIDSPLICVGYSDAEVGGFNEENEQFENFINHNKNYLKGKKRLSNEYIKKHLVHNLDSVDIGNMQKVSIDDYLAYRQFFMISTIVKKPQYDAIIYEEIGDQGGYSYGSEKCLATIDKKGRLISVLAIASFHHQGTYAKDDGSRGGYYSGDDGCISKNLIIDVRDNDIKYKVQPNGQIIKFFWVKARYDSLLTANPNNAEIHLKYATYLTNKVYKYYVDSNDIAAKKQYELALKFNPNYAEACEQYADFLWFNFKDTINAQRYFKKAVDLNPNLAEYKSAYKAFLNKHSKDKETIKIYEKWFKGIDSTDFTKQMDYAHFLYNINHKKEGRSHYLKAIQLNSNLKNKIDDELFEVKKP